MSDQTDLSRLANSLEEISEKLNLLLPKVAQAKFSLNGESAFVWDAEDKNLRAIRQVNRVPLHLLHGVNEAKSQLLRNTEQFARGYGANNALLWGAKGMGKSSLVKAVHAHLADRPNAAHPLALIEINREDIDGLPQLLRILAQSNGRFILFCDDLSFSAEESTYKSLKSALDGGIEGRPENVIFYATSNRRHLLPREMIENERATAVNPGEAIDEKVSLSDRFGLWLGFHNCDQATYFEMIDSYADHFKLPQSKDELHKGAVRWAQLRGARSGRVAMQFIRQAAGETGIHA